MPNYVVQATNAENPGFVSFAQLYKRNQLIIMIFFVSVKS